SQTFKLSDDPLFVDKVRDIIGLYLSPPNRALVLSIDEKSQIQALDREQPVLPMMPGVPEHRTHNYVRHGTTSLFAALDVASGFSAGSIYRRYRSISSHTLQRGEDGEMGHVRLGTLPKSRKWIQVVAELRLGADVDAIAAAAAGAAEASLQAASEDPAFLHAFWLLTQVPLAARGPQFVSDLRRLGLTIRDQPTLMNVAAAFSSAVARH